ncbi:MAG: alpha/beta hydrolase [Acidobacteria bacterium]|nr:alpha/beta hydrolase [Acidobacteriota bacterium]
MADVTAALPSGGSVALSAFGDPAADRLVILCHPSPGSSAFDPDPIVTNRWGVHLIALDRPGYGGTEALPPGAPHSLYERADDVAAYIASDERTADRISAADLERCGVIGWGTGAIVAAALAVRHPELVDRLALVSAPAPAHAEKLARRTFAIRDGREALHIADDDPAFGRHLGLGNRLDRMLDDAFLQGDAGIDGDRALLANAAWTHHLEDLAADVLVLTGADDPILDAEDERWWRRHLPRSAQLRSVSDSASLTVVDAWEAVLAHVAPTHGHLDEGLRDHGTPLVPKL